MQYPSNIYVGFSQTLVTTETVCFRKCKRRAPVFIIEDPTLLRNTIWETLLYTKIKFKFNKLLRTWNLNIIKVYSFLFGTNLDTVNI
jgi:hypothetical protein